MIGIFWALNSGLDFLVGESIVVINQLHDDKRIIGKVLFAIAILLLQRWVPVFCIWIVYCDSKSVAIDNELAQRVFLKIVELEFDRAVCSLFQVEDVVELTCAVFELVASSCESHDTHRVMEESL